MKRIMTKIILIAMLGVMMSVTVQAGNIVVVVNSASTISKVTASELSKLFMGKSKTVAGEKAVPINQDVESQPRADFSDKILGRTVKKIVDYWKKRIFSGKGKAPKEVFDDAKVIAYVSENSNALGYISASSLTDKVKAIPVDGKVEW